MPNNRLHQPHVPLPEIHWSPNEQWVWRKLRRGERADFNERYGVCPLPWVEEAWNEEEKARRLIRPEFLYTVLLHDPWRSALSNWGMRLGGAYFAESIEMPHAEVAHEFWLMGCRVEHGLLLHDARFVHRLVLWGCCVYGLARLTELSTGASLFLDQSRLGCVDLKDANLGGNFYASRASFSGKLVMDRGVIRCGMFVRESRFEGEVLLLGLRVGGVIDMERAIFNDDLGMDRVEATKGLFMEKSRFGGEVFLPGLRVGDEVNMTNATFAGSLILDDAELKGSLFMRGASFGKKAQTNIRYGQIERSFEFSDAKFRTLDLTGTHTQAVVDTSMDWPDKLKLDHFTYQHLGGLGQSWGQDHMLDRPASWFVNWLVKHKPYSPQPYEQCAKVLREAGQPGKAKEVLYQGKERERNEPNGDFRRWVWLTASKWLLGHGLTWRFALVPAAWAVGVLLLGWLIFCQTPCLSKDHSAWWGLGYSLSKLIPLVSFGNDISDLPVASFTARAWFTFQTLFGWFLASLIVAGLAGVGRPSGKS